MAHSSVPSERREILFSGRVQGVGFRYSTRNIARGYDVTGYVRNLSDGRVQLVCEGTASELNRLIDEIVDRLGHFIQSKAVATEPGRGDFVDFSIRF